MNNSIKPVIRTNAGVNKRIIDPRLNPNYVGSCVFSNDGIPHWIPSHILYMDNKVLINNNYGVYIHADIE